MFYFATLPQHARACTCPCRQPRRSRLPTIAAGPLQFHDRAKAASSCNEQAAVSDAQPLGGWIASAILAPLCAVQLSWAPPAAAGDVTLAVPLSRNPELRSVQQALVETWVYINSYFVDAKFNGLDWEAMLQASLDRTFKAGSGAAAYQEISSMVAALNDPFTKVLDPAAAHKYAAGKEGQVWSTGLVAVQVPGKQELRVSYVLAGSPAEEAGLQVGDVLLAVNGCGAGQLGPSLDLTTLTNQEVDLQWRRGPGLGEAEATPLGAASPYGPAAGSARTALSVQGGAASVASCSTAQYAVASAAAAPEAATQPATRPAAAASPSASVPAVLVAAAKQVSPSDQPAAFAADGPLLPSSTAFTPQPAAPAAEAAPAAPPAPPAEAAAPAPAAEAAPAAPAAEAAVTPVTAPAPTPAPAVVTPQAAPAASLGADTAGAAAASSTSQLAEGVRSVHLAPTYVTVSPVQFSLLQTPGRPPVAYVHLTSFTSTAADLVLQALNEMKASGAQSAVLDLRDNPGGLVSAGLDLAQVFLHTGDVFCRVVDRLGEEQVAVIQEGQHVVPGQLAVLVNHASTSTSELLAGALHDDFPALIIGEPTFGKGRTQLALDLSDGSTLLVSTLLYSTPSGTAVDHVGLQPDIVCKPEEVQQQYWVPGRVDDEDWLSDPCISLAYDKLTQGVEDSL